MWFLLIVIMFFVAVAIYVKFFSDLTATSHCHVISNFSIIPLLIPNTPYSDSPKASYVEQGYAPR
jgi:hypothetical protein